MNSSRMQSSRFELKYVLNEETAKQVGAYVSSFMDLDENCIGQPRNSYVVHSLYVDSDEMKTYWDTINGNKNRFKLRIRYYDDNPRSPVFLEIKSRMDNTIHKQRAGVSREGARLVLNGLLPPASMLLKSNSPKEYLALERFCRLVQQMDAKPRVHVAYLREAYLPSDNNSARVTLDRHVCSEPDPDANLLTAMAHPMQPWGDLVVLELKFTNTYPNWFRDLVRAFNLHQCGAAKYVDSVSIAHGLPAFHRRTMEMVQQQLGGGPQNGVEDEARRPEFNTMQ